jgi:selenocysteine-specific elongation factor
MSAASVNITLGTAGHIDHGKTALVKCLTGCETDRLKEEKERGMSIDLGYAPCFLGDLQVGIVDVPGHEHFVKTMVAGATGMDGVILVVAADDGVMPQTREHLDILTLLGIRHGLVALTKIDRVEPDHLELARADLEDLLRGTFLDGAPILPVSNVTGEGYDQFVEALYALVRRIQPRRVDGVFRIPVDRAFSAHGYGTVVAGIPVCGSAQVGDEVVVLPHNLAGRIKRIEVYGRASDTVLAGQCAAVNVGHWDSQAIGRGDTVTLPGYFSPETYYICKARLLPREKLHLKHGSELKFHTGTSEVNAVVYALEERELYGGDEYLIQVKTKSPVVAGPGDHFILRTFSPIQTVGGGTIVEAATRRLKRNRPEVLEDLQQRADAVLDDARFVEYCVRRSERLAVGEDELAARAKVTRGRLQTILAELTRQRKILGLAAGRTMHRDTAAEASSRVLQVIADYHRLSPESPGIAFEQLKQETQWDKELLDGIVVLLKSDGRLMEQNQRLALAGHRPALADQDAKHAEAVEALFRQQAFSPPSSEEIVQKTGIPPAAVEKTVRILCEHQKLIAVGEGFLFHAEAVERARQLLIDHIVKEGRLESVQFKYLLDTTRKYALPLLDYFDRVGLLRRSGNTRYLKRNTK